MAWAWGDNIAGALGDGTTANRLTPVLVSAGWASRSISTIAAGFYHSLALASDGTVWAWGDNFDGELGDGTTTQRLTPVQVSAGWGSRTITAIAAGLQHSLALASDGTAWAWGANGAGKLGDGTTTQRLTAVQVSADWGGRTITATAAGDGYNLALASDGTVWGWGANSFGGLGDGTTTQRLTAVQVSALGRAVAIAAGNGL